MNENEQMSLKISDFGTCLRGKIIEETFLSGITFDYGAPENILHVCFNEKFLNDPKIDIWSLGLVLYRIFVEDKRIVFGWSHFIASREKNGQYDSQIKTEIEKARRRKKNAFAKKTRRRVNFDILNLINECLQMDLQKRPKIDDVLENLVHIQKNLGRFKVE